MRQKVDRFDADCRKVYAQAYAAVKKETRGAKEAFFLQHGGSRSALRNAMLEASLRNTDGNVPRGDRMSRHSRGAAPARGLPLPPLRLGNCGVRAIEGAPARQRHAIFTGHARSADASPAGRRPANVAKPLPGRT